MEFKDKLKQTRKKLGLTQTQFADKSGFSRSTISEYENGTRNVTLTAIERIAKHTNTSVSYWLDDTHAANININFGDGLKLIVDSLVNIGEINNGICSDFAKDTLLKMLEKEIALYCKKD